MSEILNVLNSIGYTSLTDFGNSWRCDPLYRSFRSRNSLAIKKTTGQWFDHSERYGGSLAKLVQKTLGLASLSDTKAYMGDLPITVDTRESVELTEIKKFDKNILIKLVRDNSYWHERGITDFVLNQFEGGLAVTKGRMIGRYVFPIFDERNDLIGFSGRLIQKSDVLPKWKHIGQKKNFVFPAMANKYIIESKEAILVESIGDCLKLLECGVRNVIVTFGVSLSPKIIQHLLKLDVNNIVISLNNDEDSFVGNQAALEYQSELENYFDANQIKISLPTQKDFGDMTCEEIFEWKTKLNENRN